MNICFFSGKIVSEIVFKFVIKSNSNLKSKHKSICYFNLELENKTVIRIEAYNKMADFCYRKVKNGSFVALYGRMKGNGKIECYTLKIILQF